MKKYCQRLITITLLICFFIPLYGMNGCNMQHTLTGLVTGEIQEDIKMVLTGSFSDNTTTDIDGIYAFANLDNGSYTITPKMTGYSFSPENQNIIIPDDDISNVDFTSTILDGAYLISGTVSGDILEGVILTVTGAANTAATTDESGYFSIEDLDNGTYTVTPSLAGYIFSPESQTIVITEADNTEADFNAAQIIDTYLISGTVSGDVTGGVTITLTGDSTATTVTASNGNYSFTDLENGSYTVTPGKTGYVFGPSSRNISIDDANETGVNFVAATGTYSISGTVSGDVVEGVTLARPGEGELSIQVATDSNGDYSFTGLENGSYTVTPWESGYTFVPVNRDVTIFNANETGVDFTSSEIVVPTYTISGTVSGDIQAGVTITLSGSASDTTTTDASGDYSFTDLLAGNYAVTPGKSGYVFGPSNEIVPVTGSDVTGVDFTADKTYLISGTVSGDIVEGVTMTLSGDVSDTTTTDSNGDYSFSGLLFDESLTVTPGKSGYAFTPASENITIDPGDQTGVDFVANSTIPLLISPAADAVMDNGSDDFTDIKKWDFSWGSVVGATKYWIRVWTPSDFLNINVDTLTATTYTKCGTGYVGDDNLVDWYWMVSAYVGGQWQPWSDSRDFDVEEKNLDGPSTCP